MELQKVLDKRLNVKKYTSKKPKIELLIESIEAANHTPGPGALNVLNFLIIEDPKDISMIAQACQQSFIADVPYVIIVSSNITQLKKLYENKADKYLKHFVGASLENLSLKLIDLGLANCWVESFSDLTLKNNLGIPEGQEIEMLVTVGYGAGKAKKKRFPNLNNKIFFGGWGNKFHKPLIKLRRDDM